MKHIIFLITALIINTSSMWAQKEHIPFAVEGKTWVTHSVWYESDLIVTETVQGDTVIGGKACKKVYDQTDGIGWGYPVHDRYYSYALYQEGARVYRIIPNRTDTVLLYDFGLKEGEIFPDRDKSLRMIARDTVEQEGYQYVRQFMSWEQELYEGSTYIWVDGVGSERGLFDTGANGGLVGSYNRLVSCTWPDGRKYVTEYGKSFLESVNSIKALGPDIDSYYNLQGQQQSQLQKGVNIIRTKDGTTRKVLIK
ncbi:MAG: hypothetical protein ILA34_05590 [Bacteroidaceae bacterium]|nr:hypothetical protein [Bacteroidaceae bacterium]